MPTVRAFIDPSKLPKRRQVEDVLDALEIVCSEVVPAGMHSPQGPLMPGDIQFIGGSTGVRLSVSVLVEVAAFNLADRHDTDRRADVIRSALRMLFPDLSFAVSVSLSMDGYASDSSGRRRPFGGPMTMDAAVERAREKLARAGSH